MSDKRAGLQVTVSVQLADALIELFNHTVEAMSDDLDETIDDDFSKFCTSVRKAKRRLKRKQILKQARRESREHAN